MIESKACSQLIVSRCKEFVSAKSGWFRGLWGVGSILSLRELLEAVEAVPKGVLYQGSVESFASDILRAIGPDKGIPKKSQQILREILKKGFSWGTGDFHLLRQAIDEIAGEYLPSWAEYLARDPNPNPERVARSITSHLLDAGLSPDHLHRWITYESKHQPATLSLVNLVEKAHHLESRQLTDFEILIPARKSISTNPMPPNWLDASKVKSWLQRNKSDSSFRQAGGWVLTTKARDKFAASEKAADEIRKVSARLLIGSGYVMTTSEWFFVKGTPNPLPFGRERKVEVRSLERHEQLFRDDTPSHIEAAFEMLGQIPGPTIGAVAAGWAAIETLLAFREANKAIAGDRLADLVACSFPRAELDVLASLQSKNPESPIFESLRQCTTNLERATILTRAFAEGAALSWPDWPSEAAARRVRTLISNPKKQIHDIKSYVSRTFRRLYRQRNLILHGGNTTAIALGASLRTAAPLLGAGIDRIAHAWFAHSVEPMELAARARWRTNGLSDKNPEALVSLLE